MEPELEAHLQQLKEEIRALKLRNERVEADKAWEISWFRALLIALMTYFITALVFFSIGVERFLLNAVIPTAAYLISTQSLPLIKQWWITRCSRVKNCSLSATSTGKPLR